MVILKYKLIPLLFSLFAVYPQAEYKSEVYQAYLDNRMQQWKQVVDSMNEVGKKSKEFVLELLNYQYGYIGYCLEFKKNDEAKKYLAAAENNIEILEKQKFNPSVIYAYKSALYGFRITLSPISAPVNGAKSLRYAKQALELDSSNYLANVQYGNVLFHMPSYAGGSKTKGIDYYQKAREVLEKDPANLKENWNYLNILTLLGQSYTIIENLSAAREMYEYILRLEPGFIYVRDVLYPQLLKKLNL